MGGPGDDAGAADAEGHGGTPRIRLVERRDAEGIRSIYNHFVTRSTAILDLVPRSLDDQVAWIDEHAGGHPALVAVTGAGAAERVVGFASLSPYRPRPAYATTVENSVYVLDGYHGQGVGRRLLDEILRLAQAHGFHAVIARIVGDNDASIALHRSCGYELVGVEREIGRKFGQWLDIVELQRML